MNVYGYKCKCGSWESTKESATCKQCGDSELVYSGWTECHPRQLLDGRVKDGRGGWRTNEFQNEKIGFEYLRHEYPSRDTFSMAHIAAELDHLEKHGKLELTADGTISAINGGRVEFRGPWKDEIVIESTRKAIGHKEQNSWTEYQTWFRRYRTGNY